MLDLGAGDCVWSVILAEQGAGIVSVEISPKQFELAREVDTGHQHLPAADLDRPEQLRRDHAESVAVRNVRDVHLPRPLDHRSRHRGEDQQRPDRQDDARLRGREARPG